jgi:hypothetical protein
VDGVEGTSACDVAPVIVDLGVQVSGGLLDVEEEQMA